MQSYSISAVIDCSLLLCFWDHVEGPLFPTSTVYLSKLGPLLILVCTSFQRVGTCASHHPTPHATDAAQLFRSHSGRQGSVSAATTAAYRNQFYSVTHPPTLSPASPGTYNVPYCAPVSFFTFTCPAAKLVWHNQSQIPESVMGLFVSAAKKIEGRATV